MLKNKELRLEVIRLHYDVLVAKHRERNLMMNEVPEKV